MDYSSTTAQPAQYYQYSNTNYNTSSTGSTSMSSNAVISASSTVVSAPSVSASANTKSAPQPANQTNYHRKENKPVFQTKTPTTSSKTSVS